jgi:hypothetical protein
MRRRLRLGNPQDLCARRVQFPLKIHLDVAAGCVTRIARGVYGDLAPIAGHAHVYEILVIDLQIVQRRGGLRLRFAILTSDTRSGEVVLQHFVQSLIGCEGTRLPLGTSLYVGTL